METPIPDFKKPVNKIKKNKTETPSLDVIYLNMQASEIFFGKLHSQETIRNYTDNMGQLLTDMQDIYHLLQHSKLKNRFTRIINNIKKQLNNQDILDDQGSDSSILPN
uniref:Uncharacterized protein n=1 Tax=Photinus pyralis TaxID=7054 RepID=A0A1Y1LGA5_PHOPY